MTSEKQTDIKASVTRVLHHVCHIHDVGGALSIIHELSTHRVCACVFLTYERHIEVNQIIMNIKKSMLQTLI